MRMNLVKDGLYEREYYFGRKGNKVSYYKILRLYRIK